MKIFTGNSNSKFAEGISKYVGIPLGKVDLRKFSDGELYVAFTENERLIGEAAKSQTAMNLGETYIVNKNSCKRIGSLTLDLIVG